MQRTIIHLFKHFLSYYWGRYTDYSKFSVQLFENNLIVWLSLHCRYISFQWIFSRNLRTGESHLKPDLKNMMVATAVRSQVHAISWLFSMIFNQANISVMRSGGIHFTCFFDILIPQASFPNLILRSSKMILWIGRSRDEFIRCSYGLCRILQAIFIC